MFGVPIIDHCEDPSLKGDGVAHEGYVASALGLRGIPGAAESIMVERDISLAELTGGHVHIAHMSARAVAARRPRRQGARRARDVRGRAASLHADRRGARRPGEVRHELQDESAAARGRRSRRDARRASPTAASTSSPPIMRRITPTRRWSSSIARRSASSASRPRCRSCSIGWCTPGRISLPRMVELLSVNPARVLGVPGGTLAEGAPADITILAPDVPVTIDAAALKSKSKNTPFDGWELRGGVAATIVGGRVVYRHATSGLNEAQLTVTSPRTTLRQQALKKLQELEVLMRDGHFDYGNGFHGRVYLNPHRSSGSRRRSGGWRRTCSTCCPARSARADRRRRRAGDRRRAARAHDRRAARRPAGADASALQLRAVPVRRRTASTLRSFYAEQIAGQARAARRRRAEYREDVRALRRAGDGRPAAP